VTTGPEHGYPYPQNPQYQQAPQYPQGPQYAQGPQYSAGPHYGAPPMPAAKKNTRAWIFLAVVVLLVTVVGVLAWQQGKSGPDVAKVGDCVSREGGNEISIVKCTDAKAVYKVAGKVEDQSQVTFNINSARICKPFPAAKSAFWKGKAGSNGYVLCLAPAK
jgi:hypothetical protein